MRVAFYELKSNFTSCKFILRVGNKIAGCKLLLPSCKFKKIILRVASLFLWVKNLKYLFYKLPVAFYEFKMVNLRVAKLPFTS